VVRCLELPKEQLLSDKRERCAWDSFNWQIDFYGILAYYADLETPACGRKVKRAMGRDLPLLYYEEAIPLFVYKKAIPLFFIKRAYLCL